MSSDAVVYIYTNNGFSDGRSRIGRVVGFAGRPLLALLYTYINVVDDAPPP